VAQRAGGVREEGRRLKDLGKKLKDLGLAVPERDRVRQVDRERRRRAGQGAGADEAGHGQGRRDRRDAHRRPAVGATKPEDPSIDLLAAAERYLKVCEVGDQAGLIPAVEVWGFSKTLTRLADAMMVAVGAGHPKACVLADVYHLHKGGSDPAGLRLVNGATMSCLHFNDYPADPPRSRSPTPSGFTPATASPRST
jgi:sugar phosphate isomerase/epimerase